VVFSWELRFTRILKDEHQINNIHQKMFYSPELLQRRQGAFGTIWLAATLGARSSFKKLQRKDVLSIDVTSACELVKAPPEPLALRLSSHLLFGISRVYSQQYELFYSTYYN